MRGSHNRDLALRLLSELVAECRKRELEWLKVSDLQEVILVLSGSRNGSANAAETVVQEARRG